MGLDMCPYCEEAIEEGDRFRNIPWDEVPRRIHLECIMRMIVGSVGHMKGLCECHGRTDASEIGQTRRQAARDAYEYYLVETRQRVPTDPCETKPPTALQAHDRWGHVIQSGLVPEANPLDGVIAGAVMEHLKREATRLNAESALIPPDELHLYEIRIRVHNDGWRTETLERKDAPRLPCECARCGGDGLSEEFMKEAERYADANHCAIRIARIPGGRPAYVSPLLDEHMMGMPQIRMVYPMDADGERKPKPSLSGWNPISIEEMRAIFWPE